MLMQSKQKMRRATMRWNGAYQFLTICSLILLSNAQEGSGEEPLVDEKDTCPPSLDLLFLLDTSGSIEEIYHEHTKWTIALADSIPIEKNAVRVATIQYAGYPITEFTLDESDSGAEVIEHLKNISFQSGVTRTGYALRKADSELSRTDRGARTEARKVIILFTDGLSIDDPLKASENLRTSKGVKIYVVSVASDGFIPEMQRIAGNKDNTFGPTELPRLKTALINDVEESRKCKNGSAPLPPQLSEVDEPLTVQTVKTLEALAKETSIPVDDNSVTSLPQRDDPNGQKSSKSKKTEKSSNSSEEKANSGSIVLEQKPTFTREQVVSAKNIRIKNTSSSHEKQQKRKEGRDVVSETSSSSTRKTTHKNTTATSTRRPTSKVTTVPSKVAEEKQAEVKSDKTTEKPKDAPRLKKIRKVWRRRTTVESTTTETTTSKPHSIRRTKKIVKIVKRPAQSSRASSAEVKSEIKRPVFRGSKRHPASDEVTRERPIDRDTTTRIQKQPTTRLPTSTAEVTSEINESSSRSTRAATPTRTTTKRTTSTSTQHTTPFPQSTRKRNLNRIFAAKNVRFPNSDDRCSLDVLFIVDSSGSVITAYDRQKKLLLSLLGNIDVSLQSHRVALIQFAGIKLQKTEWTFDKFSESTQLMRAFGQVRHFTGTTYIGAALESARNLLSTRRKDAETIVVLLSDGFSQDDPIKPAEEIVSLSNVDFFAASLSELSNVEILNQLTADPERVFVGNDVDVLKEKLIQRFKCQPFA